MGMKNPPPLTTDQRAEAASLGDVLLVQGEDPWQDPTGGIVAMTQILLRVYGRRVEVAAPSVESLPVGAWSVRPFEGSPIRFFNIGPLRLERGSRPMIPAKVQVLRQLRRHMSTLHSTGPPNLLMDSAEALFCAQGFQWSSVCFFFHGLNNPVARSRYPWARWLGRPYQWMLLRALRRMNPDAVIAAADRPTVQAFCREHSRSLRGCAIHPFATRVDRRLFFPERQEQARRELGLDARSLILVACGRVSRDKGWQLLLDSVHVLRAAISDVHLVLVGDGEDRRKVLSKARAMGLDDQVSITGLLPQRRVRHYLNAADVCVFASPAEGWSLAMLEALACGRPLVSTDVSGAREMIRDGQNGFVVTRRDPEGFADAVVRARTLPDFARVSTEIAARFSADTLAADLGRLWPPLAARPLP